MRIQLLVVHQGFKAKLFSPCFYFHVQLVLNVLRGLDHRFEARVRGPAIPELAVGEGLFPGGLSPELAQEADTGWLYGYDAWNEPLAEALRA